MVSRKTHVVFSGLLAAGVLLLAVAGCATQADWNRQTLLATQPAPPPAPPAAGSLGAAELWVQTCNRCHNAHPANTYSNAQWQVIIQHMRLRAALTADDARRIEAYLKASNVH